MAELLAPDAEEEAAVAELALAVAEALASEALVVAMFTCDVLAVSDQFLVAASCALTGLATFLITRLCASNLPSAALEMDASAVSIAS